MQHKKTEQLVSKTPIELVPASLGLRFINYILDKFLSIFVSLLATLILMLILSILKIKLEYSLYMALSLSIYVVFIFSYYFIFELMMGRTFAKYLTKTQVISQNGRLTFLQIMGRTFARMLPFNEISVFRSSKRAWHDSLSNTFVIKSNILPLQQRPSKRVDTIMTVIASILIFLPASLLIVFPLYESLTGGERIDLPNNFPNDLKLNNIQEIEHEKADYYTLKYAGKSRTVRINRLIAGYNYEPDKECVYMTPVDTSLFVQNNYSGMLCEEIYRDINIPVEVFRITSTSNELTRQISDIPDYYIKDPPFVLVIRADSGTISQQEVVDMAKSGLKTHTFKDLEASVIR